MFTRKLPIPKLCSKIGFDEEHNKFHREGVLTLLITPI